MIRKQTIKQKKLVDEMLNDQVRTKPDKEIVVTEKKQVDIGLEPIDIKNLEKNIKKYNKDNGIVDNSGLISLINNAKLYNNLLQNYDGNTRGVYMIYQLNLQIIKLLSLYQIVPKAERKNAKKSTSKLSQLKK